MILVNEGAVALKNLHTIYCFANLKLTQYIVGFILSATAPCLYFLINEV